MDQATFTTAVKQTVNEDTRTKGEGTDAKREEVRAGDTWLEEARVANAPREFDLYCIVLYIEEDHNVMYVVHWHSYTPAYDSWIHVPTSLSNLLHLTGAGSRKMTQGDRNREQKTGGDNIASHLLYCQAQ